MPRFYVIFLRGVKMKVLKLNDLNLKVTLDEHIIPIFGAQNKTLIFRSKVLAYYWFFNLRTLAKIADRHAIQMMFATDNFK